MNSSTNISAATKARLLTYQKNEITEHHIYSRLAERIQSPENREVLQKVADDELRHYEPFKRRFLEMAGVSLGVAGFSFIVGYVIRTVLDVDV